MTLIENDLCRMKSGETLIIRVQQFSGQPHPIAPEVRGRIRQLADERGVSVSFVSECPEAPDALAHGIPVSITRHDGWVELPGGPNGPLQYEIP